MKIKLVLYRHSRFIFIKVHVHVDFVRPKEGEYEERECATVRYGGANALVYLVVRVVES